MSNDNKNQSQEEKPQQPKKEISSPEIPNLNESPTPDHKRVLRVFNSMEGNNKDNDKKNK